MTKDIKVIKNPPSGSTQPSNLFAIFTSNEETTSELPPDTMGISLYRSKFHSISTSGQEQDLVFEDGSLFDGQINISGSIMTKSGLLVGITKRTEMDTSVNNIYQLIDGKTLKLIAENVRLRVSYKDAKTVYTETSEDYSYFCTDKGVYAWNSISKSIEVVKEMASDQYCSGTQIKNQFYFTINHPEVESLYRIEVGRASRSENSFLVETLDETQYSTNESIYVTSFSEMADKVVFLVEHYQYSLNQNSFQIVQVNKNNTESSVIYERQKEEGQNYLSIQILKNGKLFNGKLLFEVSFGSQIDPVDIYDNAESYVTTVSQVNSKEFFTYDGENFELISQVLGEPMVDVSLVNSADTLFLLKSKNIYYHNESWFNTYREHSLLSLDLNLVHQFASGQNYVSKIHEIKGEHFVSIGYPQEGGGHKISIFTLPNSRQEILEDKRFSDRLFSGIRFVSFYDKVLFQATVSDLNPDMMLKQSDTISGFFGEDGLVRIINKIRAIIDMFDT